MTRRPDPDARRQAALERKGRTLVKRIAAAYNNRRSMRRQLDKMMRVLWDLEEATRRDSRMLDRLSDEAPTGLFRLRTAVSKMRTRDLEDAEATLVKAQDRRAATVLLDEQTRRQ